MIRAVIFDMGGTLEDVYWTEETRLNNGRAILDYLSLHGLPIDADPAEFAVAIHTANLAYKEFSDQHTLELDPFSIWDQYRLRDYPLDRAKLKAVSERLSHIWETTFYNRLLRPDADETLARLQARGYRLGVISNTPSLVQVHYSLRAYGIIDYFSYIGLSSLHGYKKPNPLLFEIAAADMGVKPEECAYVGDTVSRDVVGPRRAGYGLTFRINSALTKNADRKLSANAEEADYPIRSLIEIDGILANLEKG